MEIRVLRYFLATAREGSITAASDFLHITAPTLSRQIKELEDELGQKLFTRSSHSMNLTAEGMLLRKRADEIISMVDKTEAEFNSMENTIEGDIYIGSGETDAIKLIAKVAKELRDDYPFVRYHIHSGNAADVTEKLDKGLLDFGILIQPADISKYDYIDIPAEDEWGVIMRKDSPMAKKEFICREDLLDVPLICSRQVTQVRNSQNRFARWFGNDIDKIDIATTFNLVYNAAIMVEAGIGYAITIDKLVNTSQQSELCFRPLRPQLKSGLTLVWKKYQVFSAAADLFLHRIKKSFDKIEQEKHKND